MSRRFFRRAAPKVATWHLLAAPLLVVAPVVGIPAMPVPQMLHVRHYSLDLSFDPAKATVSGTVAMRFTWQTGADVPTLRVDMVQALHARSVMLDGKPGTFAHRDDILAVDLPQLAKDSTHTLVIGYSGQPSMRGIHFGTLDGSPVIASYGMPKSAREWWPNLDAPALKADSADIAITVPKGLIAASNGSLVEVKSLPDGRRQFRWHEAAAIYSDVISVAIGPYVELDDSYKSVTGRRLPLTYYVYEDDKAAAKSAFSIVPGVLRVYERLFGPYPFQNDKYGIAEFPIPSFREHQTLPSLGRGLIRGTAPVWDLGNVANVIAHDMAHQWFGNSLTLRNWSDVWLNEGFATYAVALWREAHDGKPAYREFMQSLDTAPFDGPAYIPDDSSPRALLTPTTFNKGAWALHMLRHVMGDKAFFAALQDYVQANRGGLVDTRSWLAACERAYGKPLDWFFDEWIYGTGLPALRLTWQMSGTPEGRRLELAIDQTQAGPVFTMPVDVAVTTPSGSETRVVWLRQRHEKIALPVASRVEDVVLDPQHWLLRSADRQANRKPSGHSAET